MNISPRHSADITLLLQNWQLFAPFGEEHRQHLLRLPWKLKEYRRGATIAAPEQGSSESILVIGGSTFRHKPMPDGPRQIVAIHVPGDFADLDSFVLQTRGHTISAATPALVAAVPHSAIGHMLASQPDLARWLMWEIARHAAISCEWLAAMGRQPAYQRIAHLFCELYFRMKRTGLVQDRTLAIDLYQADLGDICGLSTVHVNRSLQLLRKDRLITLQDHHVTIRDIQALSQAALFDPSYLHLLPADGVAQRRSSPDHGGNHFPGPRR